MITVRDVLSKYAGSTACVAPADTVYRALQVMAENNIGAVMVAVGDQMVGIFTERDYCRKIILMGRSSLNTPIEEIMTKKMITVRPDQTLEECIELMTKYHIRHLPVEEGGKIIGMVTMRGVMEMSIASKQERIERLENYILGSDYGH
jgi:CBS domain-containing protein